MIHIKEDQRYTVEELNAIPVPDNGKDFNGVLHGEFARQLVESLNEAGFKVSNSTWFVKSDGDCLYGTVTLKDPNNVVELSDWKYGDDVSPALVVRNSNDGRYAFNSMAGVLYKDIGFLGQEIDLKIRHTPNKYLEDITDEIAIEVINGFSNVMEKFEWLKGRRVTAHLGAYLIFKIFNYRIAPPYMAMDVFKRFDTGIYRGTVEKNAIGVLQAFYPAICNIAPNRQLKFLREYYSCIRVILGEDVPDA